MKTEKEIREQVQMMNLLLKGDVSGLLDGYFIPSHKKHTIQVRLETLNWVLDAELPYDFPIKKTKK